MKYVIIFSFIIFFPITLKAEENRSFYMGFSPWPYDFSVEAASWTYETINQYGDIVSHHIEEGVPWDESLRGAEFPKGYLTDLRYRLNNTGHGEKVLLQLTPLNIERKGLAPYRGNRANQNLPKAWSKRLLNDPAVKDSYLNYVRRMNEMFNPQYLITGVEVNLLRQQGPEIWKNFVELQCHIYKSIKAEKPEAEILVSVVTVAFFPEWASEYNLDEQMEVLNDMRPCVDGFSLSVHPFMSALLAERFPEDYFSRLSKYIPDAKGISEASYPAQQWSLMSLTWNGTPAKQDHFVKNMMKAAQKNSYEFVIWYAPRDYDAMWKGALKKSDLALIWRDTGLFDESGQPRPALLTWKKYLHLREAD